MATKSIADPPVVFADPREGSKRIIPLMEGVCDIREKLMRSGDFAWKSKVERGVLVTGVEYKTLSDFISSKREGRLLKQITNMCEDYDRRILLLEGTWGMIKVGAHKFIGVPDRWRGGMKPMKMGTARPPYYAEVTGFLWALEYLAGFRIWRTQDKEESAVVLCQAARNESQPWDSHESLGDHGIGGQCLKETPDAPIGLKIVRPTLAWAMAAQIPNLGKLASGVYQAFDTSWDMVNASVEEWEQILPKKQRHKAKHIYRMLREKTLCGR